MNLLVYIFLVVLKTVFCKRPNFVLILTDDQDILLGGLTPMKQTLKLVANEGIIFQNAFANTPVCCPSRSTILTGRYQHNTGVFNNTVKGGCASLNWRNKIEPNNIASILSGVGYNTFYAGKYLNRYGYNETGGVEHIPDGWHFWYGLVGNSRYYNYTLSENGKAVHYPNVYLTDLIKEKALEFLDTVTLDVPFFMMMGTPAPHAPFTPAPRHRGAFPNVKALRTPAFNYTPTDKHWLVRTSFEPLPTDVSNLDNVQQLRFESLLAVDELVENVVNKLESLGEIDNTYVIFTSDHGYHIGQFRQAIDKRQPYDTDISIPLLIRGPKIKKKSISDFPVSLVDLTPTILTLSDIEVPHFMDGQSFVNEIFEHSTTENHRKTIIPVEYHGEGNPNTIDPSCPVHNNPHLSYCTADYWCKCEDSTNNTYTCLRHITNETNFLYCEFHDSEGFREAYNGNNDKYQLKNIYKDMNESQIQTYSDILQKYLKCNGESCRNL